MIKRKSLFDTSNTNKSLQDKQKTSSPIVKKSTQNKIEQVVENNWKSYDESRPDRFVPCEFCVETDKGKECFYAYLAETNTLCTNEPYKLVVLRKKFNNLYYREIDGCTSINDCPNNFPKCKNCKRGKNNG